MIQKEFISINSTLIFKIIYSCGENKLCERLNIIFKDGKYFEYSAPIDFLDNSEFDLYEFYIKFIHSDSTGKFWHKFIKDKFVCKRIR